ncbi:MAG TPA: sporulation integral membrane protein YlbJ [Firmicutes bacterium]|nr:sporulation integral membrane protein YlbJ [Candidatus Fermentithermobacillaceae bacterium]
MKGLLLFSILILSFILLARLWRAKRDTVISLGLAGMVVLVALSMILFPEPSFKAAERGLKVWWDIVLPALLPFFIAAELLMGMGVVHFMGVLMEPLMRPIFNVPGTGSFAMAMGIASGYPLGAALAARLKDDGLATKTEAERLMCFCNTSDPLFMTGAVAVGMFKRTDLAVIIISAHYLSALTVGVLLRFWRSGKDESPPFETHKAGFIVLRAYRAMRRAQGENKKAFGELLGEAVKRSVNTLLLILGFIVLFSVIFEILKMAGVTSFISLAVSRLMPKSVLPPDLYEAIISGLFEITIGTSMASQASAPLVLRAAVSSAIIAWSGLSVHAQVAAVIQSSGLSVWPYTASRFLQSVLAAIYTVLLMMPGRSKWALSAFEPVTIRGSLAWFQNVGFATKLCALTVGSVAMISIVLTVFAFVKKYLRKF